MNTFRVHEPTNTGVPILLSVPHCGTAFPEELIAEYDPKLIESPDDTDWFVDQLYDFAPSRGITMISANWSRWVIDLNRDPDDKPLYADGRIITGLCPVTDFLGEALYVDRRQLVSAAETTRRRELYYWPYHHKLLALAESLKATFGKVLIWDCHSIRQTVTTIYNQKFPDLILGDADQQSASPVLSQISLASLRSSAYDVRHNFLFKGGYITRAYGMPNRGQHALQLEMSKINYMDDDEQRYAPDRASKMRLLLQDTLEKLAVALSTNT